MEKWRKEMKKWSEVEVGVRWRGEKEIGGDTQMLRDEVEEGDEKVEQKGGV